MARAARPTNALQALDAHLALVTRDLESWLALFADHAVVEFPYAASVGLPGRLEGKDAIRGYFARASEVFLDLVFRDVRRHATLVSDIVIAEAQGSATIATTSRPYEQDYVMIVQCRDGVIVHYREYWNIAAADHAFGGVDRVSGDLTGR